MANNKISGQYIIQTSQHVATYTLAGNNRSAKVEDFSIVGANWLDMSNGSLNDSYIHFLKKNRLHIKAVKVTVKFGEGLRTNRKNAANFQLVFTGKENTRFYGPIFEIGKFNEWQETDDLIEPYNHNIKGDLYGISFSMPTFNIDDYNIQTAYIGQPIYFYVEMKINTAGILLNNKII